MIRRLRRGRGDGRMRIPNKQISKEAKQSNTKHNEDSSKTEQSSKATRGEESKKNQTNNGPTKTTNKHIPMK